jgi:Ca2+-binding RTX toxin-like protein
MKGVSMFESLESRKLFAATLTNGVLEIVGTSGNDQVRVTQGTPGDESTIGSLIDVRLNGVRKSFDAADVTEIRIATGDGDDSVKVTYWTWMTRGVDGSFGQSRYIGPAVSIDAGTGQDAIQGGPTDQTIRGGEGRDTIFGGVGNDVIRGGIGNDVIFSFGGRDVLLGEGGADQFYCRDGRYRLDADRDDSTISSTRSILTTLDGEPLNDRFPFVSVSDGVVERIVINAPRE